MKKEAIIMTEKGHLLSLQQWQKFRGLTGNQIGNYFKIGETNKYGRIVINNKLIVASQLLLLLDEIRKTIGRPIILNSFDRTQEAQDKLISNPHFLAAKNSPHVYDDTDFIKPCTAADIDTKSKNDTYSLVSIIEQTSFKLGIKCRIGYKKYLLNGQSFIHIDVAPCYYAEGKVLNKYSHPWQWEQELRW